MQITAKHWEGWWSSIATFCLSNDFHQYDWLTTSIWKTATGKKKTHAEHSDNNILKVLSCKHGEICINADRSMRHKFEKRKRPRRNWKPGHQQHLGPENQGSQHKLNQPKGSFPGSLSVCLPFSPSILFFYPLLTILSLSLSLYMSRFSSSMLLSFHPLWSGLTKLSSQQTMFLAAENWIWSNWPNASGLCGGNRPSLDPPSKLPKQLDDFKISWKALRLGNFY